MVQQEALGVARHEYHQHSLGTGTLSNTGESMKSMVDSYVPIRYFFLVFLVTRLSEAFGFRSKMVAR